MLPVLPSLCCAAAIVPSANSGAWRSNASGSTVHKKTASIALYNRRSCWVLVEELSKHTGSQFECSTLEHPIFLRVRDAGGTTEPSVIIITDSLQLRVRTHSEGNIQDQNTA